MLGSVQQSGSPSAGKKVSDQRNHRKNDQNVDEEAGHVERKEQNYPENCKNDRDPEKHLSPAFFVFISWQRRIVSRHPPQ
jgi:hypothetical protein